VIYGREGNRRQSGVIHWLDSLWLGDERDAYTQHMRGNIHLNIITRGGATGKAFGLAISRSRVQILLEATLRDNLTQVVYTYVPLSPSSITWYRPKGGDALQQRR